MTKVDLCPHLKEEMRQDIFLFKRKDKRRMDLAVCESCKEAILQSQQNNEPA